MKILYFAIFLLLAALVFVGLSKLPRLLAYDREKRYLHCRLIPGLLLVLLAVTNVYTVSYLIKGVDWVINHPNLSNFFTAVLPNRAYELVYMLLMLIGLNLAVVLVAVLAILLIKLIFIGAKRYVDIEDYVGIGKILHLPWLVASFFYEERKGDYGLNSKGFVMGHWAGGLKGAFAIAWAVEMLVIACSILWGEDLWNERLLEISKAWYLLPMAGYLLVEQIQLFLEGVWEEEAGSFGSMEIQETQEGEIQALVDTYSETFAGSGALLFSDIGTGPLQQEDGLGSNDLGNRQVQDCIQPDVLSVIMNQLQQSGTRQDMQYQNGLVELLNGHSINVCDQCEGEFAIYLVAYLNFYMSQGKTALVLCQDRDKAEKIAACLRREMKRLNNLYTIWTVCTLEDSEVNGRMSMLVCSYDDFLNYHIYQKRQDFVGDLFCTVIADGMTLFSRDSICIERLFGVLRQLEDMRQYVFFSQVDNDALRTAMEQVVKKEIVPVNANTASHPNTGIMIWREESYYQLQRQIGVGNALSPYMGTALPLALVAAKYDFPQVYVLGDASRGDRSYADVLTMSGKEVSRYVAKNINLKSVIRYEQDEALKEQELSMLIAYDTDYNFLNALWRWMKYEGTDSSLIHIVSPAYALREYFAANLKEQRLLLKNNEFDALVSYRLGMKASHMAVLLVSLCDNGMTEEELMEKSKEYHWAYDNVEQLLTDCLRVVLTKEEVHSIYECFHFEEEKVFREDRGSFDIRTRITLTDATIHQRLQERIGYVTLVTKDDQRQTLPVLRGNVLNYCQREQIIAVDGYLYQVRSISDGNVYAEQTLPQNLPEYFQISEFEFRDYRRVDSCVDTGFMDMNICTAAVTRRIYGYWSGNRGNCFAQNCDLQVNDLRDLSGGGLEVTFDCANILEINIRRNVFGDSAVEAVRTFAYLLKDMAKTLFPKNHHNLFAVISEGVDDALVQRVLDSGKDSSLEDVVCSLIPWVKGKHTEDSEFITLYVVEASCIEYGMVQMLYSKYKSVMLMMREYLKWYLQSNAAADSEDGQSNAARGSYLHFGAETVPDVLDLEALLVLCRKLLPEEEENREEEQAHVNANAQTCTFCGRPSMFPVKLSDGRRMCGHCKDHQLTQRDEIKTMFVNTVKSMTEGYMISLPKNIHVRFQSADAIARATGGVDGGRILGFYNFGNHQLWLEARGPRIAMQGTLIHELTHAWQHDDPVFNRSFQRMLAKFPRAKRQQIRLLILEGHAVYMEIDAMRKLNEKAYADRIHAISMQRQDEYGQGYRLVSGYIRQLSEQGSHITPFNAITQLVQDILDGTVTLDV